jgi:hypothetical protein
MDGYNHLDFHRNHAAIALYQASALYPLTWNPHHPTYDGLDQPFAYIAYFPVCASSHAAMTDSLTDR